MVEDDVESLTPSFQDLSCFKKIARGKPDLRCGKYLVVP